MMNGKMNGKVMGNMMNGKETCNKMQKICDIRKVKTNEGTNRKNF